MFLHKACIRFQDDRKFCKIRKILLWFQKFQEEQTLISSHLNHHFNLYVCVSFHAFVAHTSEFHHTSSSRRTISTVRYWVRHSQAVHNHNSFSLQLTHATAWDQHLGVIKCWSKFWYTLLGLNLPNNEMPVAWFDLASQTLETENIPEWILFAFT